MRKFSKNDKNYNRVKKRMFTSIIFLSTVIIAIIITSIILGFNLGIKFYFLSFITLPFIYLSIKQYQELNRIKLITIIRKKWGVVETRERNFSEINLHFIKLQAEDDNKYILDDRTWSDLDMDLVYAQIDRTTTIPGEQVLYSILRRPIFSEKQLDKRNRLINLFFQNQEIREKYQLVLSRLGKGGGKYLVEMLWGDRPSKNKYAFLYSLIIILIPIFILLGILNHGLAWFGLIATLLCNMIIYYRTKLKIYEHLASIRYLGKVIRCAINLVDIKHPVLEIYRKELERSLIKVSSITKKTSLLAWDGNNIVYDYMSILFLIEVRAYYSVLNHLERYDKQLRQIFNTIGEIDAMIAVASYRTASKSFSEPQFMNSGSFLKIEEIVHPLVKKPVPNSISVESEGILITGSNMSGKTTFLKALGVNTVLAQTINTCLAKKFQSRFFNTVTLIGREDNVIEGKSYYIDEILALLRIINVSNDKVPCLCILDEIFRGTNSLERTSASAEVLHYLVKQNCCAFVSTHDLELTELVDGLYHNYHFHDEINEEGIVFDYKLLKGASANRNAIKLLRHVGYPKEISDAAEMRIKKIEKNE